LGIDSCCPLNLGGLFIKPCFKISVMKLLNYLFIIGAILVFSSCLRKGSVLVPMKDIADVLKDDSAVMAMTFEMCEQKDTLYVYKVKPKIDDAGGVALEKSRVEISEFTSSPARSNFLQRRKNKKGRQPYEFEGRKRNFDFAFFTRGQIENFTESKLAPKLGVSFLRISGARVNFGKYLGNWEEEPDKTKSDKIKYQKRHFTFKMEPHYTSSAGITSKSLEEVKENIDLPPFQLGLPCPPNWSETTEEMIGDDVKEWIENKKEIDLSIILMYLINQIEEKE